MIVEINGKELAVTWSYVPSDNDGLVVTRCYVFTVLGNSGGKRKLSDTAISVGTTFQSKTDRHCKGTARKISLARAIGTDKHDLNEVKFSKKDRSVFWQTYQREVRQ